MFQLLQPIWLFALAGLSFPVVIHLWNQRPGKTLRVGSIALVAENAVTRKKHIQLTEILLLLLRCILLACIAVALALPFRRRPLNTASKGWVLLSRQQPDTAYRHFKPVIDSLLQAGMEFHYFEEGFKKGQLADALQQPPDSNTDQVSYRRLAALLNQQVAAALPVYIFTDNLLRNFSGQRTAVALNLHWYTYTPAGTVPSPGSTDTAALHIAVYSSRYNNDARYLKAAFNAIRQFSNRKILIQSATAVSEIPAGQQWLFWLSDEPVADVGAENIVQYVKGTAATVNSRLMPAGKNIFAPVDLYTAVIETHGNEQQKEVWWQDGFGHPMLTKQQLDGKTKYHLYTHFDPAWNGLPWSENFPQLLFQLLYDRPPAGSSTATADSTQLLPRIVPATEPASKPAVFAETKLDNLFWMLAFLLFLAERLLSFHHRKITGNG